MIEAILVVMFFGIGGAGSSIEVTEMHSMTACTEIAKSILAEAQVNPQNGRFVVRCDNPDGSVNVKLGISTSGAN